MKKMDESITLDAGEFADLMQECTDIYETMSSIYDNLCDMHTHHSNLASPTLALLGVSMAALTFILKWLTDYLTPHASPVP